MIMKCGVQSWKEILVFSELLVIFLYELWMIFLKVFFNVWPYYDRPLS